MQTCTERYTLFSPKFSYVFAMLGVHALSPNSRKFFTKPFVMFLIAPEIQVVPHWAQPSGSTQ
jgi:hypothetical protein